MQRYRRSPSANFPVKGVYPTLTSGKASHLPHLFKPPDPRTSQLASRGFLLGQMVLRYAHPSQEHQARSVEHLEQFNAARQMEALLPEHEAAAGMIQ